MTPYVHGAADCFRRGIHRYRAGGVRCVECGAYRPLADVEDTADAREAWEELNRAEAEAADLYGEAEQDLRSRREEV